MMMMMMMMMTVVMVAVMMVVLMDRNGLEFLWCEMFLKSTPEAGCGEMEGVHLIK